jgi:hypothetical protein
MGHLGTRHSLTDPLSQNPLEMFRTTEHRDSPLGGPRTPNAAYFTVIEDRIPLEVGKSRPLIRLEANCFSGADP